MSTTVWFKRIVAILLAVTMLFAVMPLSAFATETQNETTQEGGIVEGGENQDNTNEEEENPDAPEEDEEIVGVPVTTLEELEQLLQEGAEAITIVNDITVTRTLYVTSSVTIYSEEAVRLIRSTDFAGDLIVVGQTAEGTLCENEVILSLGRETDEQEGLLTIDGDKENVTASVVGSALFVCDPGHLIVYGSVSVVNHKKVGNERTSHENVSVSYPVRVGGAAAIVAGGGVMDVYGGVFSGNEVNTVADENNTCVQGGAIYNYGTLNIYGGTFDGNSALFGGVFFNYRTMNIHRATISNNTASDLGGAIYMPNSGSSFTYIGEDAAGVEAHVSFIGNSAADSGGAIYARNAIDISNAYFKDNKTTSGEGGAIVAYTVEMTMDNVIFDGNQSGTHGSAVYLSGSNEETDTLELEATKVTFRNNSGKYGALYVGALVRVSMEEAVFQSNSGTYGGAIYNTGGTVDINGATFTDNTSTTRGGVLYSLETATVTLNNVTATGNHSKSGGFAYLLNTTAKIYDSTFQNNSVSDSGAVLCLFAGAATEIYNCTFKDNTAAVNAGVIQAYTSEAPVLIHSSTFTGNTSSGYGGVIHTSSKSQLELYCITATNNVGGHGGFMYITTTGTTATIGGLILSGNTATTGGNNIWGNSTGAKMYLDQGKCVENDYAGVRDDAYWSSFVTNKLKTYYQTVEVPTYINYYGEEVIPNVPIIPQDVTTVEELEEALASENGMIRLMADITLDRTLYVTKDTTIFGVSSYTLTRAADFAGDLFVVGQTAKGALCEEGVTLTLGRENGTQTDHLIIDGNKANLTVDVVGSALFVCKGATVNLYKEVTLQNHKKVGNERTSHENVTVSYPAKVGGSAILVASGGTMNIYGSTVRNNEVNTTSDENETCMQGGAIYNYGTMNVYGGLFEGNTAYVGGAFFNYRRLNLYNATIQNNVSADLGGAIYMPNSTAAFTTIGGENDVVEPNVVFSGNQAGDDGGAIYARNSLSIAHARFENNTTKGYGGAIIAQTVRMTMQDVVFSGNSATSYGGAIYLVGNNGREDTLELSAQNVTFENNVSNSYGGVLYLGNGARAFFKNASFTGNQGTYGGVAFVKAASLEMDGATIQNNTASTKAGVLYAQGDTADDGTALTSTVVLNKVDATGNSAVDCGFANFTNTTTEIYASHFANNTASASTAVMYLAAGADTKIYGSVFENNEAAKNGGVITAYSSEAPVLIQNCQFLNNTCHGYGGVLHVSGKTQLTLYDNTAIGNSATHGGFMYETTAGTVVKLVKLTVDDNTASTGGPIIWGNTFNAKLYIDKSQMNDLDHSGAYDDAYWAAAIVNKLTVIDISEEVPKYLDYKNEPYPNMQDATDVHNAEELETAINAGHKHIRVVSDFELDRTFYITKDVTIFSTFPYTLTRAADFGGDIFLVGETAEGEASFIKNGVATLTLGNPDSVQENLLTIDGNKANMTVPVVGSVLCIVFSGNADLHKNVTIINAYKNSNERVYDDKYVLKPDVRVGGSVALVISGTLNIYGGNYCYNEGNAITQAEDGSYVYNAVYGGAIFNYSNTRIHGGNFAHNNGSYGAVIYNYQTLEITGGVFENNVSTNRGGVIYVTDSSGAHTLIGTIPEEGTSQVVFRNNTASSHGGVIYSGQLAALVIYEGAVFDGNYTPSSGGAICTYGQLSVYSGTFSNNVAGNRGGAVYFSYNNEARPVRYVKFENCVFENNQGYYGGALSSYASSAEYVTGGIAEVIDCTFTNNHAVKQTAGTTKASGGAIYADRRSHITITGSTFSSNTAQLEGGTLYAAGESEITVDNSTIDGSISEKHGGAITVRSSILNLNQVTVSNSQAVNNGGAIYVSYQSNREMNSKVNIADSTFSGNTSTEGYGGAIYATKRTLEVEHPILTVKNTDFIGNSTKESGGALFIASNLDAYLKNVDFTDNVAQEGKGGALYTASGIIEYDTGNLTGNRAEAHNGGAINIEGAAVVTLNNLTATDNYTGASGGFMMNKGGTVTLYNSTIKNNQATASGGGVYSQAALNAYRTVFEGNVSGSNGGAVVAYSDGKQMILQDCELRSNSASFGGGIYASGSSLLDVYNIIATGNNATKGGFLYETTTGTVVTLGGVTLSGNTATEAPIIWGNSTGAVLKLDKANYTDSDHSGAYDDVYWAAAIVNELTVEEAAVSTPTYSDYVAREESVTQNTVPRNPVSVDEIFDLAENSSEGFIDATYDAFPRLDNSSNFMSNNTTVFEDINGGDVTVDTIVYHPGCPESNMNFSQGMLIYQAMLYKQAHPEEDVDIHITSYRFSVQAGLCINRDSRYFGYMRQMPSTVNYDEFGFVRISYLLVTAAKMGVNVTVVGHQDGYPLAGKTFREYFEDYMVEPCDPSYVGEDKQVGDYLTFAPVDWTLQSKGGTDMMHLKLCAVSDYLDMNGVAHHNAVWTSSSNLDGIKPNGSNANLGQQTAIIISDHEDIYRISTNYVDLMTRFTGQEEIYEFQHILNYRSTKQIDQFLTGNGSEVDVDKQVVYVGTETDDVFELYFTPMGGGVLTWDEDTNSYCKYIREMYESEDYIEFIWNAAEYTSSPGLVQQMEAMINASFHENRNANNKVYMNTKTFTGESFDDLVVGQDIGLKSFNKKEFGAIHNKDVNLSYVKNGQRYYVSLMNSMNVHGGSMYYQANHMLVIKETDCDEDSVFFTIADEITNGFVEHAYGDLQMYLPDTSEHGYCYRVCTICGKQDVLGEAHNPGEWVVDREFSEGQTGLQHRNCVVCGALAESAVVTQDEVKILNYSEVTGRGFGPYADDLIPATTATTPHTFEATVKLPTKHTARAGVILGNYTGGTEDQLNLEVYTDGKLRLFYIRNGVKTSYVFNTDIRSDEAVKIALTVDGTTALVYLNGLLVETATLPDSLPEGLTNLVVGGDLRSGNAQYFRGTIYSVHLFEDVRSDAEILLDQNLVSEDEQGLLYGAYYTRDGVTVPHIYSTFCDESCNVCGFVHKADDHTYDSVCDTDCNVCGAVREEGLHSYDTDCDPECNLCGAIREVSDHIYDGVCDSDCNSCGTIREAEQHTYDNACDMDCNVCGDIRTPEDHVYDDICDEDCNVCGAVREDVHMYSGVCDADCNACGEIRPAEAHTYADSTDTECDVCGHIRVFVAIVTQPHSVCVESGEQATVTFEATGDGLTYTWYFANRGSDTFYRTGTFTDNTYFAVMDATRNGRRVYCVVTDAYGNRVQTETVSLNMLPHTYDNACDTDCNLCGEVREDVHVYDSVCDLDCNECGAVREGDGHIYDNACDATCNECGAEREVSDHVYDNACDATCNECGAEREPEEHTYILIETVEPTCGTEGKHTYTCTVCNDTYEDAIPATGNHVYTHDYDVDCDVCGTVREVVLPITFGGNSVSEDVSGLAFRFDVTVTGMQVNKTTAVYDNATVGGYKLLGMGALASNAVQTVDIPAVYLFDWSDETASYAVRLINIPETKYDIVITVIPYFVIEVDGQQVTIFGEEQAKSYNAVMNG